jgi:prepilin-type N-terminal cleavage/methylation domain-containing protein
MKRSSPRDLGFTLIELLVGVAVAGFALAATANIAQWGLQASNRGIQSTELADRARLVGEQLRLDLELAGMGSTGAIGAHPAVGPWNGLVTTAGARLALPAIRGIDNVMGSPAFVGGAGIMDGSDVVQIVVPSPADMARLGARQVAPATLLDFSALAPGHNFTDVSCPSRMVYILDGSAPNGAGRAQVARVAVGGFAPPNTITLADQLQFTAEVGAQVMCARVSTYWLDVNGNLRRTDVSGAIFGAVAGSAIRSSPPLAGDVLTPGVDEFQVAYALSAAASDATVAANNRWVFQNDGSTVGHDNQADWFEVRQVRFIIVMRNLRDPDSKRGAGTMISQGPPGTFMNGPTERFVETGRSIHIVDTTAALSNLRYFDRLVPDSTEPEPY